MKIIGILTSGGDAPGMNAAIRGVARAAFAHGMRVKGIRNGFDGLLKGDIYEMDVSSVGDIINRGGTILGSARSEEFNTPEGVEKGARILRQFGIDGLVVLGGDGSFRGARDIHHAGIQTVGIPCTIDNDQGFTDWTIGFHTALATIVDNIRKLEDTAGSLNRCILVEVMGRHCGDLALYGGIAAGAESIIVPERPYDLEHIERKIQKTSLRGKRQHIIVVAEGVGHTEEIMKHIVDATGADTRSTILGHIQRGGAPVPIDALWGTIMGAKAVEALEEGSSSIVIGNRGKATFTMPIDEAITIKREFNEELYQIADMIAS